MSDQPPHTVPSGSLDDVSITQTVEDLISLSDELDQLVDIHPEMVDTAQSINSIKEAIETITLKLNPLESSFPELLEAAEKAIHQAHVDIENIKSKPEGNLGELEALLNNSLTSIQQSVVKFIREKSATLGTLAEGTIGAEDFTNIDTFLGPDVSEFWQKILEAEGIPYHSGLIAEGQKMLEHDKKIVTDTGKLAKRVKTSTVFVVTTAILALFGVGYYLMQHPEVFEKIRTFFEGLD